MDSNDSKERNDYPRWPASKGPGFFSAFLQEMAGFMMRNKLYVFAKPTVAQLPDSFPTGGIGTAPPDAAGDATAGATTTAVFRVPAKFYNIDSQEKYEEASMNAWGYLSRSVQDYPELRDAINAHLGD